ncbi:lysine-tRNA ligase [Fonsecaea pedrosoi CBS 271.37]|uniref:Lysine-tRNA ligase n=1 Tax=Fonsecaea pedrosoi CBS 271.37 TaxID=1442368 RepID=A0A0D2G2Q3_9EURO|nr:lysine-tRNA ligase [Fonsecaea pedrosoi CBS 271.37]KIW75008.1 lysine-tRNA ligase [Fonsecaea pedrosoi CBS 271.37]
MDLASILLDESIELKHPRHLETWKPACDQRGRRAASRTPEFYHHTLPAVSTYPSGAKLANTAGKARLDQLGKRKTQIVLTETSVSGRVTSIRLSGSKLAFVDITEDQTKLQVMLSHSSLEDNGITLTDFKHFCRLLRRGDYISLKGVRPYKAKNGQVSIRAAAMPIILSPCLQRFPVEHRGLATTELAESNFRPRHVEMQTDPEIIETMKARATLIRTMRQFFESREFVEVSTPILSAAAGGATAKPFETKAMEFPHRKLSLRIAPELWLKRLIVGGLDKVFEIGPSFRNEGLDKTHNPEFTTCEFYAVRHDLRQLMDMTMRLVIDIHQAIRALPYRFANVPAHLLDSICGPYEELDFIPSLNSALGTNLPNLSSPSAYSELLELFRSRSLPVPSNPTVPRLVDKLSSLYLEPNSLQKPLWITNIPECLSPLAKSYIHPTAPNGQPVAARAELFMAGKEVVNCYEEENSPFEQRRKFMEQQKYGSLKSRPQAKSIENGITPDENLEGDEEAMKVDEDYLRALEWGLPPTGGWGCGIDRLMMLFTGKERIGDVLSFGNLRAVTRGAEGDSNTAVGGSKSDQ